MDGGTDRRTDGWKIGQTDGRDGRTDGRTAYIRADVLMYGQTDKPTGQTYEQMDGWTDGGR